MATATEYMNNLLRVPSSTVLKAGQDFNQFIREAFADKPIRPSKLIDQAASLRRDATAKINNIKADKTLSDFGKQQQIEQIRRTVADQLVGLRQSYDAEGQKLITDARHSAFTMGFNLSATEAEKIGARTSYRQALIASLSFESDKQASEFAKLIANSQDRAGQKALANVAYERQWLGTLQQITSDSADIGDGIQALLEAESQNQSLKQKMELSAIFSALS